MFGQPTEELGGPLRVRSHPLELADTFRTRELTCQRYPKWYFFGLLSFFLLTHFTLLTVLPVEKRSELSQSLAMFTHVWIGKSMQKDVFPHGIVIERWFEHLVRFQYSYVECKANLNENTLFLQIDS
jgi:hypothetical protein